MATLVSDDYNRANSTTVIGAPQIGPTPTVLQGVGGISSNQLYASTAPMVASYAVGTPNVELTAVLQGLSSSQGTGLCFGITDVNNYWLVLFRLSAVEVFQCVGGLFPLWHTSLVRLPVAGSTCKASHRDGVLRAYVDGTLVLRWKPDTAITGNGAGIRMSTASLRFVDSLLIEDAPVISEPTLDGALHDDQHGGDAFAPEAFTYLGRDTKLQDAAAGA
jgi:hypothetical protein